jgi:hypothetical protein
MSTDPIALFEETSRRFVTEDWEGVADLCDPASLSVFRRNLLGFYAPRNYGQLTAEEYLKHSPDMPREVAEYRAQQQPQADDPLYRLREDMPRINSLEELHALSSRDLYVEYLRSQSPRTDVEKQLATGRVTRQVAERALAETLAWYDFRPIGVVMAGERMAHVLYRTRLTPESYSRLEASFEEDGVPEDERELERDLLGRWHAGVFICRRGPNGQWHILASERPFGMGSVRVWIPNSDSDADESL